MTNLKERYNELISLTQLYIQRECQEQKVILTSPALHSFYFKRAKSRLGKINPPLSSPPPAQASSYPDPQLPKPAEDPRDPIPQLPPFTPEPQPLTPPSPEPAVPSPDPIIEPIQSKMGGNPSKKLLALEPLSPLPPYQMDVAFKALIHSHYPTFPIYEHIPDDAMARRLKQVWQKENTSPSILILTFNQNEQHTVFLKNIAKAVSLRLAPARVVSGLRIEAEKKWDKLIESKEIEMIIACDYGFFLQPGLKQHHKEDAQLGKHYLGGKPLLLLSDLDLYLQQPQLKALLWQAICNEFAMARRKEQKT